MFFPYGDTELEYIKEKDKRLGKIIDQIGLIQRPVDTDLFSSLVRHIIGQQISSKAGKTIWNRLEQEVGSVTPGALKVFDQSRFQSLGMTFRKAGYLKEITDRIIQGTFDLRAVEQMEDQKAIEYLCSLPGVGVWTAEMVLLFGLQHPDILSFGDLAIRRGMQTVYQKEINRAFFEKVRKRLHPYGSTAALYFWEISVKKKMEGLSK